MAAVYARCQVIIPTVVRMGVVQAWVAWAAAKALAVVERPRCGDGHAVPEARVALALTVVVAALVMLMQVMVVSTSGWSACLGSRNCCCLTTAACMVGEVKLFNDRPGFRDRSLARVTNVRSDEWQPCGPVHDPDHEGPVEGDLNVGFTSQAR